MEHIRVVMVRENIKDIPQHPLPEGYAVRLYRPGDKDAWVRLQWESDSLSRGEEMFDNSYGYNLPALERRCFFLVAPDGHDAGTITAWYHQNYRGLRWGRIHWLGIIPQHRRKRLSRSLMTVAMNCLARFGHRRAMLGTRSDRIPAIRTYLNFGFVPDMRCKDAERGWRFVQDAIDHPALSRL
ncbi:MAG: GNAT family N-acetyltransferase [Planctomycetota bacterium]|nr:GNAT family N-acetyltransferase [Planctomycetota bacterium]